MQKLMKKIAALGVAAVLVLSCLAGCDDSGNGGQADSDPDISVEGLETVNIALEIPLSGSGSWAGQAMLAGAQIALKNMEADFAGLGVYINLVANDHQASNDVAATDITKDIELYHCPVVIGSYTGPITSMIPSAEESKVLVLNPAAMGDQLVGLSDWLYNLCPSYAMTCDAMAEYLYNEQGLRNVVLLGDDTSTSLAQREDFAAKWESLGGTVLLDVECESETTDFLSVCSQIKKEEPECILMCSSDEDMQQRQMLQFHQLGVDSSMKFAMVGMGDKTFGRDFDYETYAVDVRVFCPDEVVDLYNTEYMVDDMEFSKVAFYVSNFGNAIMTIYQMMEYCVDNNLEINGENMKTALDTAGTIDTYGGEMTLTEGNNVTSPVDIYRVIRGEAEQVSSYYD